VPLQIYCQVIAISIECLLYHHTLLAVYSTIFEIPLILTTAEIFYDMSNLNHIPLAAYSIDSQFLGHSKTNKMPSSTFLNDTAGRPTLAPNWDAAGPAV
jgi:hypothetical protein